MNDVPLKAVLRHLRNLAALHRFRDRSDGELLDAFAEGHDEDAFSVVVRRHGPMVLGVCRRVLGQIQDAEDAFQATFLLLARKADSIRKRASLSSWLHGVAYRMAHNAKRSAARRQRHEDKAPTTQPQSPEREAAWRELQTLLDDEIQQLPERYRTAFILCSLEGHSLQETARRLHVKEGTVGSRLNRARELLRNRLARRGVELSLVLAAVSVSSAPAAAVVPTSLVATTVEAAALYAANRTLATASVAALVQGVNQAMFIAKAKVVTVVLLTVGVVGTGTGTWAYQRYASNRTIFAAQQVALAAPNEQPKPVPPQGVKKVLPVQDDKEQMIVTGVVQDAEGKPLPQAAVAVVARPKSLLRHAMQETWPVILGQSKADGTGRFRLTVPRPVKERFWESFVMAGSAGHGLTGQSLEPDKKLMDTQLRLPRELVMRRRLIDLQGQPAAGVRVDVVKLMSLRDRAVTMWLNFQNPPNDLACWPKPPTTDAQGYFSLAGLSAQCDVTIQSQDERYARQKCDIKTADSVQQKNAPLLLLPKRVLDGTVTHADTGKPAANARVIVLTTSEHFLTPLETHTDANGRFRVSPYAGNDLQINVHPAAGEPYVALVHALTWPKTGAARHEIQLALRRGVLIRGIITEAGSGQPVANASVFFQPRIANNPFYKQEVNRYLAGWEQVGSSGADGKFQLGVLPGPGHLLINGPTTDYLHDEISWAQLYGPPNNHGRRNYPDRFVALNLKPDSATHDVTVELRRGVTVKGRVLGQDGKPVAFAALFCRSHVPFGYNHNPMQPLYVQDGNLELHGCDPEKPEPVFILDSTNQSGVLVKLSGKQAGETATIQLQRCGAATGRFVDEKGQPLANMRTWVQMIVTPGAAFWDADSSKDVRADDVSMIDVGSRYSDLRTDAQGRVTYPTLVPGATYRIIAEPRKPGRIMSSPTASGLDLKKDFAVEPGQTLDLKDITVTPRR